MANHCYNSITFHGKDLGKIKEMIAEAIETNDTKHEGWLPETLDKDKLDYVHYLFDVEIVWEVEDEIQISCWTKWAPPMFELEHIGKESGVSCTCYYEELGMGLFGKSFYDVESNYTTDIFLDDEEINRVQYDEENDCYILDGEVIESDSEAYHLMLEEKLG